MIRIAGEGEHPAIPILRAAGLLASPGHDAGLVLAQDGRGVVVELRIARPPPADLVDRVWRILGRMAPSTTNG